ncbi:MAG: uncharacterized protein PWR10_214 [Halanaerobiales bacterium]|nr:uncharacterized protein [Halanaerobiales bacterium]
MERYYRYSKYLREKYGVKTYKLPVNLPVTCPNRDGLLSEEGCAFCGEKGGGFDNLPSSVSVKEQLIKTKEYIGEKYGAEKFIAYYQTFTSSYLPLDKLLEYVAPALEINDIVEVSISTRPDCINQHYLKNLKDFIDKNSKGVNLSLELGLQTVNYRTLKEINRGHTLAEFIDAVLTARSNNVEVGVHLILNLPGDNKIDAIENAKVLSALKVDNVKLHALYIREGSDFAGRYKEGKLEIISMDEYIERVITFLEYLDPKIAVQRLLGRAPEENSLFVNWDHSWWKIHQLVLQEMKVRDTFQGKKFNYLQGKCLQKFI